MSEGARPHETGFGLWLDAVRWMAALAVLVTHTGNRLLTNVQAVPSSDRMLVHYAYQFAAGFAHQAVMVFFVISGFLVGGSVWHEFKRTRDIDMAQFLTKRLVRLCIVLVPVFAIGAVLDVTGGLALGGAERGIYHPELFDRLSPGVVACNAAFLQNFACWQLGSNGALWSLAHEFWYYLLWPVFLLALFSGRPVAVRVALLAGLAAAACYLTAAQFTGSPLLPYFAIWMLGVWAAACKRPVVRDVRAAALLFLGALAGIRVFVRYEVFAGPWAFPLDLGLGVLFANLIAAMRVAPRLRMPPARRLHQHLAEFSFSLYCLHTPILMAYAAGLMTWFGTGWQMVPRGVVDWAIVAGGLILCLASSYLLSLVTEKRTPALRRWIFDRAGWSAAKRARAAA